MSKPYEDLVNAVADNENVPQAVAQALVDTENARRNPSLIIQESWGGGSVGLTMITLRTAQGMGFTGTLTDLTDPATNLTYGLRYLRQMYDQVGQGSWLRARAGYNAGPDLTPWPAADVERFSKNLARWTGGPPDFQGPPAPPSTAMAGFGGLLLLAVLVGWVLPALLGKGRT